MTTIERPQTVALAIADPERRLWVSVDPVDPDVSRYDCDEWVVLLKQSPSERGEYLDGFQIVTNARGEASLAEIDEGMWVLAVVRSQPWQLGSGFGFVAWVTQMTDEWEAAPTHNMKGLV